jgi:hypothetical protein
MTATDLTLAAAAPAASTRLADRLRDLVAGRRAGSLLVHCLLAWLVALLLSLGFVNLVHGLLWLLDVDATVFQAPDRQATFKEFFGTVAFAPLVETLLLGALLWVLSLMSRRPRFVAVASSLLWGALHGAFGLIWFFGTAWSFYIFSVSYLAWRPQGWRHAFVAAALPHALINLTAMALLFAGL